MRCFSRASRPPSDAESGETLIEVMVAVSILGISMVAILGALWVTTRVGDFNRKTSQADLVLRDYAETLKARGEHSIGSAAYDATYRSCATLGTTGTYPSFTPPDPNEDYVASITKIEFLDGYTGTEPNWKVQSAGCPAGGDQGIERLTLRVNGPDEDTGATASESTTIIKRDKPGEL